MKRIIIAILALLASFGIGFFVRSNFIRLPSMGESSSIHFCSCVMDNPTAQQKMFRVADKVNELIATDTKSFASKHNVSFTDFQTILIIRENGNFNVIYWCSNSSSKVSDLEDKYQAMTSKHIDLYREALKEVHDTYHTK